MKLKLRKVDSVKYALITGIITGVFSLILLPLISNMMGVTLIGLGGRLFFIVPLLYLGFTVLFTLITFIALALFNYLLSKMNGIEFDIDVVEPVEESNNEKVGEVGVDDNSGDRE